MKKIVLLIVVAVCSLTGYTTSVAGYIMKEEKEFIQTITNDIKHSHSKGYVLEKKFNEMNTLYILSNNKSTQTWKVADKVNKKVADLGLIKK